MVREPGRAGCAFESLARHEPLIGTASRVRRWLVIEQPGAWGRDALLQSRLDGSIAAAVDANARAHGVRVLLARQREREGATPSMAFLARSDRVHRWIEQLEVDDPSQLATLDLSVLTSDEAPGIGTPRAHLHLVCTNGKHDPCCADLGRPVVRALREAGADVWESSHVGGDRFAANLVCLPTGVYFGRVTPAEAPRILRDHDAGLLDLASYRGRSCYPPLMQAAEIFARRELDERRLDAAHFVSARSVDSDRAIVTLTLGGDRAVVEVARSLGPADLLTCSDPPHQPWRYRLESFELVSL